METYSVLLLILLLNGSYGDENANSKVPDNVTSTTTSTTLDPLIELIMRPLLQKKGNTISIDDVLRCLRPLPDMIKSQKQELITQLDHRNEKLIKMKDQETSKQIIKDEEISKQMKIKDDEVSKRIKIMEIQDEKIKKLTNDIHNSQYQAAKYLKFVAYCTCALRYKMGIEKLIDTIMQHPKQANLEDIYLIHRKIQEERSQRKILLGEIVTKLGELAMSYIRRSKNNPGKTSALVASETPVKAITGESTTCSQTMMISITATTNAKSTTIKWKAIDDIKKKFIRQIKNLIRMKIVGHENAKDSSFLSSELSWLSEQQQYNDEIWKRWESKVLLWKEYYQNVLKCNASCAPQIVHYSNSLQRTLDDEEGGLLSAWGVYRRSFRKYAAMYENQTRKASFSELEMKCLWILYVEKDTLLHKAVEMLLEQSPESNRNMEKSINNDLLYYQVCHSLSIIYENVSANLLNTIPDIARLNNLGCPIESPAFNDFLSIISRGNPRIAELSLAFKQVFSPSE